MASALEDENNEYNLRDGAEETCIQSKERYSEIDRRSKREPHLRTTLKAGKVRGWKGGCAPEATVAAASILRPFEEKLTFIEGSVLG